MCMPVVSRPPRIPPEVIEYSGRLTAMEIAARSGIAKTPEELIEVSKVVREHLNGRR